MLDALAPLQALRARLDALPRPVVVYNKSHSGSRLLAGALRAQGVFMGARRNESEDALPFVELQEHLVERYYPDYGPLWRADAAGAAAVAEVAAVAERAFDAHLAGYAEGSGRGWGLKLCEIAYALPVVDYLLPRARVVHLVRDGRDVAFCDHVAPELPFWRKVYFNTAALQQWRGLPLTHRAYLRRPHLYNALHWANSVLVGRAFGAMLRERYLEVRYEDLCRSFEATLDVVLAHLQLAPDRGAARRLADVAHARSVGKYRSHPARAQREVLAVVEPTLRSLGYPVDDEGARGPRGRLAELAGRLLGRLS